MISGVRHFFDRKHLWKGLGYHLISERHPSFPALCHCRTYYDSLSPSPHLVAFGVVRRQKGGLCPVSPQCHGEDADARRNVALRCWSFWVSWVDWSATGPGEPLHIDLTIWRLLLLWKTSNIFHIYQTIHLIGSWTERESYLLQNNVEISGKDQNGNVLTSNIIKVHCYHLFPGVFWRLAFVLSLHDASSSARMASRAEPQS